VIAIVDTGGANLASIQNALQRLGTDSEVTSDREKINEASHLILPGVGHAQFAMEKIIASGLKEILASTKKPVLGICLGMQLMFAHSEEGNVAGLGILPGSVTALKPTPDFRVPHMGWSTLQKSKTSKLLEGLSDKVAFYFVHTYKVPDVDALCAVTNTPEKIPAIFEFRNFYGVQFHPEKSGDAGARLLENFFKIKGLES
jgi:imidazole glycerol-phosphate synthase subunit HisH